MFLYGYGVTAVIDALLQGSNLSYIIHAMYINHILNIHQFISLSLHTYSHTRQLCDFIVQWRNNGRLHNGHVRCPVCRCHYTVVVRRA